MLWAGAPDPASAVGVAAERRMITPGSAVAAAPPIISFEKSGQPVIAFSSLCDLCALGG